MGYSIGVIVWLLLSLFVGSMSLGRTRNIDRSLLRALEETPHPTGLYPCMVFVYVPYKAPRNQQVSLPRVAPGVSRPMLRQPARCTDKASSASAPDGDSATRLSGGLAVLKPFWASKDPETRGSHIVFRRPTRLGIGETMVYSPCVYVVLQAPEYCQLVWGSGTWSHLRRQHCSTAYGGFVVGCSGSVQAFGVVSNYEAASLPAQDDEGVMQCFTMLFYKHPGYRIPLLCEPKMGRIYILYTWVPK